MPSDMARITSATGLEPQGFIQAIPEQEGRERAEPSVLIDGQKSLIILKWSIARHCAFYGHSGCRIYDDRPSLCRTYPFRIENKKLADMRSRACAMLWMPAGQDKEQYVRDIERYRKELKSFNKLADRWNRLGGGTLEGFLSFCMKGSAKSPPSR
jgi:Fe-S-cluster containining protein